MDEYFKPKYKEANCDNVNELVLKKYKIISCTANENKCSADGFKACKNPEFMMNIDALLFHLFSSLGILKKCSKRKELQVEQLACTVSATNLEDVTVDGEEDEIEEPAVAGTVEFAIQQQMEYEDQYMLNAPIVTITPSIYELSNILSFDPIEITLGVDHLTAFTMIMLDISVSDDEYATLSRDSVMLTRSNPTGIFTLTPLQSGQIDINVVSNFPSMIPLQFSLYIDLPALEEGAETEMDTETDVNTESGFEDISSSNGDNGEVSETNTEDVLNPFENMQFVVVYDHPCLTTLATDSESDRNKCCNGAQFDVENTETTTISKGVVSETRVSEYETCSGPNDYEDIDSGECITYSCECALFWGGNACTIPNEGRGCGEMTTTGWDGYVLDDGTCVCRNGWTHETNPLSPEFGKCVICAGGTRCGIDLTYYPSYINSGSCTIDLVDPSKDGQCGECKSGWGGDNCSIPNNEKGCSYGEGNTEGSCECFGLYGTNSEGQCNVANLGNMCGMTETGEIIEEANNMSCECDEQFFIYNNYDGTCIPKSMIDEDIKIEKQMCYGTCFGTAYSGEEFCYTDMTDGIGINQCEMSHDTYLTHIRGTSTNWRGNLQKIYKDVKYLFGNGTWTDEKINFIKNASENTVLKQYTRVDRIKHALVTMLAENGGSYEGIDFHSILFRVNNQNNLQSVKDQLNTHFQNENGFIEYTKYGQTQYNPLWMYQEIFKHDEINWNVNTRQIEEQIINIIDSDASSTSLAGGVNGVSGFEEYICRKMFNIGFSLNESVNGDNIKLFLFATLGILSVQTLKLNFLKYYDLMKLFEDQYVHPILEYFDTYYVNGDLVGKTHSDFYMFLYNRYIIEDPNYVLQVTVQDYLYGFIIQTENDTWLVDGDEIRIEWNTNMNEAPYIFNVELLQVETYSASERLFIFRPVLISYLFQKNDLTITNNTSENTSSYGTIITELTEHVVLFHNISNTVCKYKESGVHQEAAIGTCECDTSKHLKLFYERPLDINNRNEIEDTTDLSDVTVGCHQCQLVEIGNNYKPVDNCYYASLLDISSRNYNEATTSEAKMAWIPHLYDCKPGDQSYNKCTEYTPNAFISNGIDIVECDEDRKPKYDSGVIENSKCIENRKIATCMEGTFEERISYTYDENKFTEHQEYDASIHWRDIEEVPDLFEYRFMSSQDYIEYFMTTYASQTSPIEEYCGAKSYDNLSVEQFEQEYLIGTDENYVTSTTSFQSLYVDWVRNKLPEMESEECSGDNLYTFLFKTTGKLINCHECRTVYDCIQYPYDGTELDYDTIEDITLTTMTCDYVRGEDGDIDDSYYSGRPYKKCLPLGSDLELTDCVYDYINSEDTISKKVNGCFECHSSIPIITDEEDTNIIVNHHGCDTAIYGTLCNTDTNKCSDCSYDPDKPYFYRDQDGQYSCQECLFADTDTGQEDTCSNRGHACNSNYIETKEIGQGLYREYFDVPRFFCDCKTKSDVCDGRIEKFDSLYESDGNNVTRCTSNCWTHCIPKHPVELYWGRDETDQNSESVYEIYLEYVKSATNNNFSQIEFDDTISTINPSTDTDSLKEHKYKFYDWFAYLILAGHSTTATDLYANYDSKFKNDNSSKYYATICPSDGIYSNFENHGQCVESFESVVERTSESLSIENTVDTGYKYNSSGKAITKFNINSLDVTGIESITSTDPQAPFFPLVKQDSNGLQTDQIAYNDENTDTTKGVCVHYCNSYKYIHDNVQLKELMKSSANVTNQASWRSSDDYMKMDYTSGGSWIASHCVSGEDYAKCTKSEGYFTSSENSRDYGIQGNPQCVLSKTEGSNIVIYTGESTSETLSRWNDGIMPASNQYIIHAYFKNSDYDYTDYTDYTNYTQYPKTTCMGSNMFPVRMIVNGVDTAIRNKDNYESKTFNQNTYISKCDYKCLSYNYSTYTCILDPSISYINGVSTSTPRSIRLATTYMYPNIIITDNVSSIQYERTFGELVNGTTYRVNNILTESDSNSKLYTDTPNINSGSSNIFVFSSNRVYKYYSVDLLRFEILRPKLYLTLYILEKNSGIRANINILSNQDIFDVRNNGYLDTDSVIDVSVNNQSLKCTGGTHGCSGDIGIKYTQQNKNCLYQISQSFTEVCPPGFKTVKYDTSDTSQLPFLLVDPWYEKVVQYIHNNTTFYWSSKYFNLSFLVVHHIDGGGLLSKFMYNSTSGKLDTFSISKPDSSKDNLAYYHWRWILLGCPGLQVSGANRYQIWNQNFMNYLDALNNDLRLDSIGMFSTIVSSLYGGVDLSDEASVEISILYRFPFFDYLAFTYNKTYSQLPIMFRSMPFYWFSVIMSALKLEHTHYRNYGTFHIFDLWEAVDYDLLDVLKTNVWDSGNYSGEIDEEHTINRNAIDDIYDTMDLENMNNVYFEDNRTVSSSHLEIFYAGNTFELTDVLRYHDDVFDLSNTHPKQTMYNLLEHWSYMRNSTYKWGDRCWGDAFKWKDGTSIDTFFLYTIAAAQQIYKILREKLITGLGTYFIEPNDWNNKAGLVADKIGFDASLLIHPVYNNEAPNNIDENFCPHSYREDPANLEYGTSPLTSGSIPRIIPSNNQYAATSGSDINNSKFWSSNSVESFYDTEPANKDEIQSRTLIHNDGSSEVPNIIDNLIHLHDKHGLVYTIGSAQFRTELEVKDSQGEPIDLDYWNSPDKFIKLVTGEGLVYDIYT